MNPDDSLPALLQRELAPGESIRWQGAPRALAELLRPGNWLFPVLWLSGSVGWTILVLGLTQGPRTIEGLERLDPASLFPVVGALACLQGLFMLAIPIRAARRAARTLHAITDRRLLRIERGRRLRVLMVPLARIDSVIALRSTIRVSATTIENGNAVGSGSFYLRGVPDAAKAHALLAQGVSMSLRL